MSKGLIPYSLPQTRLQSSRAVPGYRSTTRVLALLDCLIYLTPLGLPWKTKTQLVGREINASLLNMSSPSRLSRWFSDLRAGKVAGARYETYSASISAARAREKSRYSPVADDIARARRQRGRLPSGRRTRASAAPPRPLLAEGQARDEPRARQKQNSTTKTSRTVAHAYANGPNAPSGGSPRGNLVRVISGGSRSRSPSPLPQQQNEPPSKAQSADAPTLPTSQSSPQSEAFLVDNKRLSLINNRLAEDNELLLSSAAADRRESSASKEQLSQARARCKELETVVRNRETEIEQLRQQLSSERARSPPATDTSAAHISGDHSRVALAAALAASELLVSEMETENAVLRESLASPSSSQGSPTAPHQSSPSVSLSLSSSATTTSSPPTASGSFRPALAVSHLPRDMLTVKTDASPPASPSSIQSFANQRLRPPPSATSSPRPFVSVPDLSSSTATSLTDAEGTPKATGGKPRSAAGTPPPLTPRSALSFSLSKLEAIGATNLSHDLDRQLAAVRGLVRALAAEAGLGDATSGPLTSLQVKEPKMWSRTCLIVSNLLIAGIRASRRCVYFSAENTAVQGGMSPLPVGSPSTTLEFRCKFRDPRSPSLVENCVVACHALARADSTFKGSFLGPWIRTYLIHLGRARSRLHNSNFFGKHMVPPNGAWPERMSEMVLETAVLFLGRAIKGEMRFGSSCGSGVGGGIDSDDDDDGGSGGVHSSSVVMSALMAILAETEPRVPGVRMMMNSASATPFAQGSALARFVIEVSDDLVRSPAGSSGSGGVTPQEMFAKVSVPVFMKELSQVYAQQRIECMAAANGLLDYFAQARHGELLEVTGKLLEGEAEGDQDGVSEGAMQGASDLERFTVTRVQEAALHWSRVERAVCVIQEWWSQFEFVYEEEEDEDEEEEEEGGDSNSL